MQNGSLILSPIGLGNFLMCLPTIEAIQKKFPHEKLGLLALKKGIKQLAEPTQLFGQIHLWEPDKEGLGKGISTVAQIRRQKYQRIYCLFPTGHPKYSLFRMALGIPEAHGFHYGNFWDRTLKNGIPIQYGLHDTAQNFRLVSENKPGALHYPIPEGTPPQVNYLVCHPGSSMERMMEHKRLSPRKFGLLCQEIYVQKKIKTLLIGGPEEAELRAQVQRGIPEEVFLQHPTKNLQELAVAIKGALCFIGNDSGLMHYSNALGVPALAFFGPTDASRTGPWQGQGSPAVKIITPPEADYKPCWTLENLGDLEATPEREYRCMERIPLEYAKRETLQFINSLFTPPQSTTP